ncbi:Cyclin [Spironucleus salmonicida]|uniref:Cyclin n=1 Tax=Spironucleus salmonicida TaxID=348837 RepID=V6LR28_9EUKA|nr:Cyclin [Spironucleus salmonicida]|eukprot:EST43214.1 Cyclin [Spironucleus salmonicida]
MNPQFFAELIYNQIKLPPNKQELRRIAQSQYSVFLSQTAPSPSLEVVQKFVNRLLTRCHICDEQLLQAYMLITRLNKRIDFSINPYSWQKLVTVSFQLLNKFFNDKYVWVKQICAVSGIQDVELVKLEMLFTELVEFDLYYSEDDYKNDWAAMQKLKI